MQKDTAFSIFRALLTLGGTYLIGHNLFGQKVDSEMWQVVAGTLLTLIGVIWGIADKTATIEAVQSGLRSALISGGGLLVAAGKLSGQSLEAIIGMTAVLIPMLQSHTSKIKIQQLASGKVEPTDTGKVVNAGPKIK